MWHIRSKEDEGKLMLLQQAFVLSTPIQSMYGLGADETYRFEASHSRHSPSFHFLQVDRLVANDINISIQPSLCFPSMHGSRLHIVQNGAAAVPHALLTYSGQAPLEHGSMACRRTCGIQESGKGMQPFQELQKNRYPLPVASSNRLT